MGVSDDSLSNDGESGAGSDQEESDVGSDEEEQNGDAAENPNAGLGRSHGQNPGEENTRQQTHHPPEEQREGQEQREGEERASGEKETGKLTQSAGLHQIS